MNADGSDITGITYPVKVDSSVDLSKYKQVTDSDSVSITVTNRGKTTTTEYKGKDALFENESYAYYTLSETPVNYKEVSADAGGNLVFSEVKGQEATKLEGVTAELLTESSYGDYQLNLDGLPEDKITSSNVNAVVVKTTDGTSYGMRHLENIWRGNELAWSTGFTDAVHNCPTSSEHYKSMMGKTIDSIEYYTTDGIYTMDIADLYVPAKFAKADSAVRVSDADVSDGKTTIEKNLPDDFDPEYSVDGLDVTLEGSTLTYKKADAVTPGKYTLTVKDKAGKYADIKVSFLLTTKDMPAAYDTENKKLVEAEGSDADALNAYNELFLDAQAEYLKGKQIVIVAEGDAGFYSSIQYVYDKFEEAGIPVDRIAGIPAFIAAGALAGIHIVKQEEQINVIPGTASFDELSAKIENGMIIVIMKLPGCQEAIHTCIRQYADKAVFHYFENVGTGKEYYTTDITIIHSKDFPYFSLLIVQPR